MKQTCPKCETTIGMRKIMYGLPDGPPHDSEVVLGGCCVEENDPQDLCLSCGWKGTLNSRL